MLVPKHAKQRGSGTHVVLGTASQIVGQFGGSAIGILILKVITGSLGTHSYGVYSAAIAYVTTFSILTDLGVNAVTPREIAANPESAARIARANVGVRLFLCSVAVPGLFAMSWLVYPHNGASFHLYILIASAMLVGDAFRSIMYAVLIATYRNSTIGMVNLAQQIILLALVFVCSRTAPNVAAYLGCFVVSYGLSAIVAFRAVADRSVASPTFTFSSFRSIMRNSGPIGLLQIVNMLYLKFGLILLSVISTFSAVGIYSLSYTLISAFVAVPTFIMAALIPALATSSRQDQAKLIQKAFIFVSAIAALLAASGFIVSKDLVHLVAPKSFASSAKTFEILLLGTSCGYITTVFSYASISLGRHHKLVFASIFSLAINVGLDLILIPHYGVVGAASATSICDAVLMLGVYSVFRRESGIHIHIVKPIASFGVAATLAYIATAESRRVLLHLALFPRLVASCILLTVVYAVAGSLLRAFPEPLTLRSLRDRRSRSALASSADTSAAA